MLPSPAGSRSSSSRSSPAHGAHGVLPAIQTHPPRPPDPEPRLDHLPARITRALISTLPSSEPSASRPIVGVFHSFIFYGFVFYGLVNLVGCRRRLLPPPAQPPKPSRRHLPFPLPTSLSFLVLLGVVALVIRRFARSGRRTFRFNERTLLHPSVRAGRIRPRLDHRLLLHPLPRRQPSPGRRRQASPLKGPSHYEPFATLSPTPSRPLTAKAFASSATGEPWAACSPSSPTPLHQAIHLFMAPLKYTVARRPRSGVIPPLEVNLETSEAAPLGAANLEDLAWPRLLDAYACIQCNRCQDVCPASATGKSLSPAALEINKRMELNQLASGLGLSAFETGTLSPSPLLQFALSPEAAWACTTCGACMQVCPVEDEQMLDILDIRRRQVMIEGEFPAQLQSAFRGMERAQNPWGINRAKRLDWADGLNVRTTEQNPTPDVLYWVGCAASYDPSAQKTARAFVQLLDHAGVDYAVLGKRECCTGDSARRAGNEYLYRQLADENVVTLNQVAPKLIVASCPHCMNSIGKEYAQIGGNYQVMHHTEYLQTLVAAGKLAATPSAAAVTYHDPCYLGRHNGVYDAPRNLLNILSNDIVELDRNRENSFCCGAGGAQFWKEEEPGDERISDNRFREAQATLTAQSGEEKVLAVGCPFCKSMLASTPLAGQAENIVIRDVAELLLEGIERAKGISRIPPAAPLATPPAAILTVQQLAPPEPIAPKQSAFATSPVTTDAPTLERKKWQPRAVVSLPTDIQPKQAIVIEPAIAPVEPQPPTEAPQPERKKWTPKGVVAAPASTPKPVAPIEPPVPEPAPRPKWQPKAKLEASEAIPQAPEPPPDPAPTRKKWNPKKPADQP